MGNIKLVLACLVLFSVLLAGCCKRCTSGCSKGGACSDEACRKFWEAKNPCEDGLCSKEERVAYAMLGYECAKARGMVPVSPKYGLHTLECPIEISYDCNAKCPPGCAEIARQGIEVDSKELVTAETGFLLTVFDTEKGPQYVIIEAEKKYNPQTKLNQVARSAEDVAALIAGSKGKVVVYLTEFPLVLPEVNQKSRQLKKEEVAVIRNRLPQIGKNIEEVNFVRWK